MIIRIAFLIFWTPQAVRQLLNWTYWLQVKEYRLDRFGVFWKSKSGRKKLGILGIIGKLGLLALTSFGLLPFWLYFIAFAVLLLFLDFRAIKEIRRKILRKPVFTQRAKRILGTAVFIVGLTIFLLGINHKSFLIGEFLLLIGPFVGIFWTTPIVSKIKKQEVAKARKKLAKIKPKVVGVTGSYGKGTTKEFVAHLLASKYKVAKTAGSQNTEFGIARNIDNSVNDKTEFFMVEMGAYKKGEIANLAEIAKPEVGIITGIEEQHLSLFGDLGVIEKAKFELIEALPRKGVAIFNLTNKSCQKLAAWATKLDSDLEVLGYCFAREKVKSINADLVSELVSQDTEGVFFEVKHGGETRKIYSPLKGVHFVENLSCAILVARYFGVSWTKIVKRCETIKTPERTMQIRKSKGVVVIDDSFNNTPLGFKSALAYLSLYTKKPKIVITPGIIELGAKSHDVHKRLGKMMANSIDKIILTNSDFSRSMIQGLGKNGDKLVVEEKFSELKKEISKLADSGCVLLIEGRIPTALYEHIVT
jgi:UDP-N-acetylmuramoyl-tripeptide--D-alanyl-D-alanine ligase